MKGESEKIISTLRTEFQKIRDELMEKMESMELSFQTQLAQKDQEISKIRQDNASLRKSVTLLEEKLDDSDAYERRDCIVLSGDGLPAAENGENCLQVACQLVKDKLRVNLQPSDISTAHRLGRKPATQGPDRRKIIIKLCRRDLKRDILDACKQLKPGFFANESLTPTRNTIIFALRRMKRSSEDSPVKGTATIDGRVFVWIKSSGASRDLRLSVNSRQKLEEFSLKYMKKPLSDYVTEWP